MRKTSKVKEVKMNRTRKSKPNITDAPVNVPDNVEAAAQGDTSPNGIGISAWAPVERPRFYHVHQIEMALSDFLSKARAANRGESLLHLENARVFFEQACESLRKANHQECRL